MMSPGPAGASLFGWSPPRSSGLVPQTPTPPTNPTAQAPPEAVGSRHRIKALLLLGAASLVGFFYLRGQHKTPEKAPAPAPRPIARAEKHKPPPEKPELDDDDYPDPIVDHAAERAEALRRYRKIG